MKKKSFWLSCIALLFATISCFAQQNQQKITELDEVVVTATKFKMKKEQIGKVVHKITSEMIQQNSGKSLEELLNNIPGIEIKGTNTNLLEPKSIYIRGGRNRQVLVLVDGVPVLDPSAINQEFDLRFLSLSQIESIEILKGAFSTVYGSGAATGVINIILKKPKDAKISGSYEAFVGTNNDAKSNNSIFSYKNQHINLSGTLNAFNFLTSFNVTGTDGMSAAKSKTNQKFETDSYYSKNGLLKLGYQFNRKLRVETFLNVDAFDYDFDAGVFSDSDVNRGNQTQNRFVIRPSWDYNNGKMYLLASLNTVKRNFNEFNSFTNTLDNYQYEGKSIALDLVHKYDSKHTGIKVITGINYQKHSNETKTPFGTIDKDVANFNTIDPYTSLVYVSNFGLAVNIGGRLNTHSVYNNHFVYDASLAYLLTKNKTHFLKLLTSYSTAFIAPSLYQLYDDFSGNINLKPESNKTFEAGFEYRYKNWFSIETVYFNRKEKDAIIFDTTTFKYTNGSSHANGLEVGATVFPIDFMKLDVFYTHINKYNIKDFDDYIPKNKVVIQLNIEPTKNVFINFNYKNVGERTIFDRYGSYGPAEEDVILPTYQVLDFSANYKLIDETVTFFGSISNLLNEDYDDVLGYSTRGRNYKLGIRLQF